MPWHFTTWLDLADHWQSLFAGILALAAAGIAVIGTAVIERRKSKAEVDRVRLSLAIECRILLARAYAAWNLLSQLAQQPTSITARQVESFALMPGLTVFPMVADRIGLLEDAMDVVTFYGLIEVVVAKANELQRYRTPDDISPRVIGALAAGFLTACAAGLPLLQKLKTGAARDEAKDAGLVKLIQDAQASQSVR